MQKDSLTAWKKHKTECIDKELMSKFIPTIRFARPITMGGGKIQGWQDVISGEDMRFMTASKNAFEIEVENANGGNGAAAATADESEDEGLFF